MTLSWFAIGSALWLGILTSISPCPLATTIAAISYVGRRVGNARMVLLSGLLYTIGRTLAYVIVGMLVIKGLLSIPGVSNFLQHYMNKVIGPVCILVGLVLLEIVRINIGGTGISKNLEKRVETMGVWGAGLLGFLFAMAFCPTSAGLFFGGLVPIAVKGGSIAIVPAIYGIGTAVPVIIFAVVIAFATNAIGRVFKAITVIDKWARKITAVLFLLVGLYLVLTHWCNLHLGF
jgi:cytochrome c biogenesis protein CcdA